MEKDILSIFYQNKGILSISLKAPLDGNNTRAEGKHWHKHVNGFRAELEESLITSSVRY